MERNIAFKRHLIGILQFHTLLEYNIKGRILTIRYNFKIVFVCGRPCEGKIIYFDNLFILGSRFNIKSPKCLTQFDPVRLRQVP